MHMQTARRSFPIINLYCPNDCRATRDRYILCFLTMRVPRPNEIGAVICHQIRSFYAGKVEIINEGNAATVIYGQGAFD